MRNPIFDENNPGQMHETLPDLDDLIRQTDEAVVCKHCGKVTREVFNTDKGYMCYTHRMRR